MVYFTVSIEQKQCSAYSEDFSAVFFTSIFFYPNLANGAGGEVVSRGPVVLKSTESLDAEFDSRPAPYQFPV